jgi:S-adenosyl methyltransferase
VVRWVHEIVARINPAARVVCVDNDPIVLVHARALLADPTRTIAVEGDVRERNSFQYNIFAVVANHAPCGWLPADGESVGRGGPVP